MTSYIFPRPIQEAINKANRREAVLLQANPELRFFMREVEPLEADALDYQELFEPKNRRGCSGCATYAAVVVSPQHRERLHFFTSQKLTKIDDLERIAQGLSMLAKSETEEDWARVKKLVFENAASFVPYPIEYPSISV